MIRSFLQANRVGVKKMLLTEYNETETMAMFKEEGREEGWKEGREEGREETLLENIRNLMDGLKLTARQAMDILKVPREEQQRLTDKL